MADNVNITPGSGNIVAADEVTDGTLGTVKVQYTKVMDGTIDSTNKLVVSASGAAKVDGSAVTQPVSLTSTTITGNVTVVQPTGTNLHTVIDSGSITLSGTSPVSGTVTANQGTPNSLANGWPVELSDGTNLLGVTAHPVRVDPTGTTTQPVSGTVTANIGTSGSLALDASVTSLQVSQGSTTSGEKGPLVQGAVTTAAPTYTTAQTSPLSLTTAGALRTDASATTQPISGTVTATQATGTNLHVVVDTAPTTAVTQSTSPWVNNITQFGGVNISTGTGASGTGIPRVTVANDSNILATQSGTWTVQPGNTPNTSPWLTTISQGGNSAAVDAAGDLQVDVNNPVQVAAASLGVTATGAAAAAVTATLPAVAGQFHYITGIEIVAYTTVARTGSATVVLVTSTNLPGSNVWDFQSAAAIGTSERQVITTNSPIKSAVVNTATTIVCPATTSVIWRVNVYYFTAA